MIENDVTEGKYIETSGNTLCSVKRFQDFRYHHLYKHEHYEVKRPHSNQPCRFSATVKTHKFKPIEYFI